MSHRLSLSKYGLALQCSCWARPDVRFEEKPVGKAARVGTLVHRLAELHAKRLPIDGDPAFDAADPHEYAEALAIYRGPLSGWIDTWLARDVTSRWAELRLRYDTSTDSVREVPRRGEAGYSRPGPSEVTGELDFMTLLSGGVLEVIDLKTGSPKFVDEAQTVGYGVLGSRFAPGVTQVRVRYLFALKTKLHETDWITMDVDTLDAEAGRISKVLRLLPTAKATPPKDEEICKYRCPMGRGQCPEWTRKQEEDLEQAGFFG